MTDRNAITCKLIAVGEEDQSTWQYVTIPEKDLYDQVFPTIFVNNERFEAGKRYFACPSLAQEVQAIIARAQAADLRLMRPDKHEASLRQVSGEGQHSRGANIS